MNIRKAVKLALIVYIAIYAVIIILSIPGYLEFQGRTHGICGGGQRLSRAGGTWGRRRL